MFNVLHYFTLNSHYLKLLEFSEFLADMERFPIILNYCSGFILVGEE